MSVVANVAINVDSRGATQQLRAVQQGAVATDNAVSGLLKTVGKLTIALGAMQAVKFVFAKTAELESQTRSLEVLTGSAVKAKQIIQELQQLGAVTPFTSSELIDSAKRLQAFGVEADKVVETTRRLADVSGATGAELQGLVTAYGQVQAKGRLQGEELLQFQERGIALQGELQKMYGLSGQKLQEALAKGRISSEAVEVAIIRLTNVGGKYADGAIAQSDTLNGKFSTLIDNVESLARRIGEVLSPALKAIFNQAIIVIDAINNAIAAGRGGGFARNIAGAKASLSVGASSQAVDKITKGIGQVTSQKSKVGINQNLQVLQQYSAILQDIGAEDVNASKAVTLQGVILQKIDTNLKALKQVENTQKQVKKDLEIPALLTGKGKDGKDKAARDAEKAAKLAQKLAEDSAQYQIQIDDQIFKNQVELDKMRYDLQRQLQEKQLSNFVNKFTGAAKEQAGIIQSMVMGSASFDAQIKDIENKIKEAQQRLQSGTRMNQVQSTTVGGGGGFSTSQLNTATQAASKFTGVANMCSESVKAFYGSLGITLPGVTAWADTVRKAGTVMTDFNKIKPGDILATGRPGDTPHVGVYTGGQNVFHQSKSRGLKAGNYPDLNSFKGGYFVRPNAAMGGVAGGVPGENVDQTKAEIQGLMQQLALLKSQSKSLKAEDLTAGILASTSAFREQTAQLGLQTEAFTLRNRLQMEGVKPELIEGELKLLEVRQQLNDRLKPFNELLANGTMTQEQYAQATDGIKVAAENAAIAIQTYTAATAAASSPIQQFIGSAQTQLKDLESVAVRVSQGIGDAVGNSLTRGIQGLVEGTTTAQQVFADFLKTVGDILMQEGAKMIATYMAIAAAKALAGLFGGGAAPAAVPNGTLPQTDMFKYVNLDGLRAAGGPVSGNSTYMVGEKGPELFVPSAAGTIIPAGPTAGIREAMANGNGQSNASPVLNMSFESSTINGVEYVSRDQLETAMMETRRQASRDGAKRGMTMTLDRLQQSPSTRSRIGLG